ncbi:hypothetical protein BYT27DRAFT_7193818 [Phlegmacium glaucopus]|nr:hypothetical protein BYT27DRAFT_7193818 [Phlegmacium glaucopus]
MLSLDESQPSLGTLMCHVIALCEPRHPYPSSHATSPPCMTPSSSAQPGTPTLPLTRP